MSRHRGLKQDIQNYDGEEEEAASRDSVMQIDEVRHRSNNRIIAVLNGFLFSSMPFADPLWSSSVRRYRGGAGIEADPPPPVALAALILLSTRCRTFTSPLPPPPPPPSPPLPRSFGSIDDAVMKLV
jgi:hypothetical protein